MGCCHVFATVTAVRSLDNMSHVGVVSIMADQNNDRTTETSFEFFKTTMALIVAERDGLGRKKQQMPQLKPQRAGGFRQL